jgi:DNA primase
VLDLLNFTPSRRLRDQLRGPCPLHESHSEVSRSFSVTLTKNAYRCFVCGAAGNQLDLWSNARKLNLYDAAVDLCNRLNVPIPWMETRSS